MNMQYQFFLAPGTSFYDVVTAPAETGFPVEAPDGWQRSVNSEWVTFQPPGAEIPDQGWKIHVSSNLDNAVEVLDITTRYCFERGIVFKHLQAPYTLLMRNSKYGDRGGSGKFLTVYPVGDDTLEQVVTELGDLLRGQAGPYVLSDLRWEQGPLYVRYGGFRTMLGPDESGRLVHCLRHTDGTLVPDRRGPSFRLPDWVELPQFLEPAVAARNTGTLRDFPFRPTSALHFSNGGGVYLAQDQRTGDTVLLKEGRPFAGLDESGRDAVARLEAERAALEQLRDVPQVPDLLDYRKGHEHFFLVREYVDGRTLSREVMERNPLMFAGATPQALAEYTAWAVDILDQVERGVAELHRHGIVFGDLHPNNILVGTDGAVHFIDFETASTDTEGFVQTIGAPGFRAPEDRTGTQVDTFALGCVRLSVFLPLTVTLNWGLDRVDALLDTIRSTFPVADDYLAAVRAELLAPEAPRAVSAPSALEPTELRGQLARGILAAATPARTDRLYPGDIAQFTANGGGLGFAHGAAGVLWALDRSGFPAPAEHLDWLVDAVDRTRGIGSGFVDGLAGIAYALDRLGRSETAGQVLERVVDQPLEDLGADLADGISGIALTLLDRYRRHGDRAALQRAGELVANLLTRDRPPPRPGLLHGGTGQALLLLDWHRATGETDCLEKVPELLRSDLVALGWPADPTESPQPGPSAWRQLTLIGSGSAGLVPVLSRAAAVTGEAWLKEAATEIARACRSHHVESAGLFGGRAGAMLTLINSGEEADPAEIAAHRAGLDPYFIRWERELYTLGQGQLRLSTDLATGSAGVLLALTAVGDPTITLPFLEPESATRPVALA